MENQAHYWVLEQPSHYPPKGVPTRPGGRSGPRRAHRKSKTGCQSCRRKKIKCDEVKPECRQCLHRRIFCVYSETAPSLDTMSPNLLAENSMSRAATRAKIKQFMRGNGTWDNYMHSEDFKMYDVLQLLEHWIQTKGAWIGTARCETIMQNSGLELAFNPGTFCLFHAILAFSASHLHHLEGNHNAGWSVASTVHYSRAHSLYLQQIRNDIDSKYTDQLVACCLLLEMITVWHMSMPVSRPQTTDMPAYLIGLGSIRGILALQGRSDIRVHVQNSIWQPLFALEFDEDENEECQGSAISTALIGSGTIEALDRLFGNEHSTKEDTNIYRGPLKRLKRLFAVELTRNNIGWFMKWLAMLPLGFIQLLTARDERAMIILSYWSALFSQIDQWWIVQTARTQCAQISQYLERSSDPEIRTLLHFPLNIRRDAENTHQTNKSSYPSVLVF